MPRLCSAVLMIAVVVAPSSARAQPVTTDRPLNETEQLGLRLFTQSCGVCHLAPSMNAKTYGPPLNKTSAAGNDEVMRAFIVNGTDRMPAFKYYLKPAEIDAIIAYVRTVPAPVVRAATEPQK